MQEKLKQILYIIKKLDRKIYLQMLMIAVVGIFFIRFFAYMPYVNKQQTLLRLQKKFDVIKDFLGAGSEISKYDKTLFKSSDVGEILPYLNSSLEKNNIQVSSLTQTAPARVFNFKTRSFLVKFNSNFHKLLELLKDIEAQEKGLFVDKLLVNKKKVDITKIEESVLEDPELVVELTIKVFTK